MSCDESIADSSSELGQIWQEAMDRYAHITGNKHIIANKSTAHIGDIVSEFDLMGNSFNDQRHNGSKLDRFRSLVSTSLAPIQALSEIAAQASKAVFPPSEAIFAAIRYLITTARNVSADFDRLAEFFLDVKSYLTGIEMWEKQVPSVPGLKSAITEVFSAILVLCGMYTKYINRKRIVKAFHTLASGGDTDLMQAHQRFLKAVNHGRDLVRNATLSTVTQTQVDTRTISVDVNNGLSSLKRLEQRVDSSNHGVRRINRLMDGQDRATMLNWISTLNFQEYQREVFTKYQAKTGQWLLNAQAFQEWVHSSRPSTIWCPGNQSWQRENSDDVWCSHEQLLRLPPPLQSLSAAICHVEEHTPLMDTAIAHVYCNYKESKTHLALQVWSSVVRQFAEQCDPFPAEVQAFRDNFIQKRSGPTDDDFIALVKSLSGLFEKSFIFIDALDECPEQDRESLIDSFAKLGSSIRLFVTSRYSVALEERISPMTRLDIAAHEEDVRAYLEHRLSSNSRLRSMLAPDPALKELIKERLSDQANGMFLLVHLQMNYLCSKRRLLDVRKALDTLAKDIHQFYDDSFQRMEELEEEDKEFALRILSYVFCARRPLTMDELLHALSVDPEATDLASEAMYESFLVLSVSSGLVQVDKEGKHVRLAHHTLHEHLQRYPEKLLAGHEQELATACVTYLSFETFASGPCVEASDMIQRLDKYCFLDYACRHWADHAANSDHEELTALILSVLQDKNKLASCVQLLYLPQHRSGSWHNQFPTYFTCLHAAAYWGLSYVLRDLVEDDEDIDCEDGYGTTPLLLSAKHGHIEMLKRLLEMNANVDASNHRGETALALAARYGHEAAVELLLARGASPTIEDTEGWTALHWAIMGRHNGVARVLLGTAWTNQSNASQRNKALILTAEFGSHIAMQLLLDEGVNVDFRDEEGSTPLHWAVPEGHLEASRVLLANGADPTSRDNYDNTPMHWTVPHSPISPLLVSFGADVNAKNDVGQSTLIWSALAGKMKSVETLTELGADINQCDDNGFTALHAAALIGHEPMTRLLLNQGADANRLDRDGWTALHAAALKERTTLVDLLIEHTNSGHAINNRIKKRLKSTDMRYLMEEMADRKSEGSTVVNGLRSAINSDHDMRLLALLDNGADIDAEDDVGGCTALTYAAWFGREKTVRLLLDRGADVDLRERTGRTALHRAAESGYTEIVQDLVEKGKATVDLKVFGWTAMLLAARTWQSYIVVYLVEHGADVDASDFHGRTALHWSCIHGDKTLAKELLRLGAEVDAQDHYGQTALFWAVACRQRAIVRLLMRHNAATMGQAHDGSTVLHVAAYTGQLDVLKLLFVEQEKRQQCRARAGERKVAEEAIDWAIKDTDGFSAADMACLTGNQHTELFLRALQADGAVNEDVSHVLRSDIFVDKPQREPQSRLTKSSLDNYKDAQYDYLSDECFDDGLGRALISRGARKWMLQSSESGSSTPGLDLLLTQDDGSKMGILCSSKVNSVGLSCQ